jgi:hypothetical protein
VHWDFFGVAVVDEVVDEMELLFLKIKKSIFIHVKIVFFSS